MTLMQIIIAGSLTLMPILVVGWTADAAYNYFAPPTAHTATQNHVVKPKAPHPHVVPSPVLLYDEICNSPLDVLPGVGAPSWARAGIYSQILGAGGYGAVQAGCLQEAHSVSMGHRVSWYSIGVKNMAIASVTIAWGPNQSVTFLNPAAPFALQLLSAGVPISGSNRINVGGGDFQLIFSDSSTYALVRATKVSSNSGATSPYSFLSPLETAAWFDFMRNQHEWVWPLLDNSEAGHDSLTLVSANPYGAVVGRITPVSSNEVSLSSIGSTTSIFSPARAISFTDLVSISKQVPEG